MSKQTINIGASPNDGTGTPLRTSFDYTNQNFTELYTALGGGVGLPGATTQVIFNDGGTNLAGDAGLVYNKTTDALTVAGLVTAGSATITGAATVGTTLGVTGDLTVATDAFKVISATKDVCIGTVTPTFNNKLTVVGGGGGDAFITSGNGTRTGYIGTDGTYVIMGGYSNHSVQIHANDIAQMRIAPLGVFEWFDGAGGTRMTLNSSGNLGIGVTPSAWASTWKAIQVGATGSLSYSPDDTGYTISTSNGYWNGSNWIRIAAAAVSAYSQNQGKHSWLSAASSSAGSTITFGDAKMTLDASGNLLVGTTSNAPAGTQSQIVNEWSGGAKWGSTFNQTVSSATPYTHIAFCTNGTVRGSIDANNVTLTYGIVSDYRLKENVQPISSGLSRVNALKPSSYKWKDSGTDGEGFIAHELASVVPLAVIGQKDAVNEDGSIKAQQIDLSKVVPILVAAIQELTAEVNALKNA